MLAYNFSNLAVERTLTSGMDGSQTTATFSSLVGFPAYPYFVVVDRDNSSIEVLEVTGLNSGNTVNVVRGYGDTSPVAHSSGAKVLHVAPAEFFSDVLAAVNNDPIIQRVYTANATWTKPSSDSFKGVLVECQGGGGAGGGSAASTTTANSVGAGGNGGNYARVYIPAASLGSTAAVVVGAGGTPGAAGAAGGTGGNSSFGGTLVVATGGAGGAAGGASTTAAISSLGGSNVANSGTAANRVDVSGGWGEHGVRIAGAGLHWGGAGGPAFFAGIMPGPTVANTAGQTGLPFGGGGSGSRSNTGVASAALAGGAGGAGLVVVTEFYG